MEEKNKKMNKGMVIGISVFAVVLVAFFFLVSFNPFKLGDDVTYEEAEYKDFLTSLKADFEKVDTSDSYEDTQVNLEKIVQGNAKTYSNGLGTSATSFTLLDTITNGDFLNTDELMNTLLGMVDSLLGTSITGSTNENVTQSVLSLRSNTVCDSGTFDSKYCVDGLSAKVYIANPESKKWAVILHGVLMNGKQIYSSLGDMYTTQGYNVLAPDLRGFGDSDGSVAMGYLESLDVYDWIKDLNSNFSRYGVKTAPDTIVVHGVSLGAATTLQLATNPDIAAKKGGPYTKTLSELNVKGFVDDCGYTSMSGIITGMLSMGDSAQLTSLLGNLGIDVDGFMSELQEGLDGLVGELGKVLGKDITSQFDFESIIGGTGQIGGSDIQNMLGEMNKFSGFLDEAMKNQSTQSNQGSQNNQSTNDWSGFYGDWSGSSSIWPGTQNGSNQSNLPNVEDYIESDKEMFENLFPKQTSNTITNSAIPTLTSNSLFGSSSSFSLDDLVGTLLMNLVGIGLTEDNYDLYSNVFAGNRNFPSGTKVVVIHGDADTTVPPSNAKTIAEKAGDKLLYNWSVSGAPHAFVVVGSNKTEYTNLIGNFTNCIEGNCSAFDSNNPLNSIVE